MRSLKSEVCAGSASDLLDIAGVAIAAMQEVIAEKLHLFGSVGKAHLHETPYARSLAGLERFSH